MLSATKIICLDQETFFTHLEEVKTMFDARLSALENKIEVILSTLNTVLNTSQKILTQNKSNGSCCTFFEPRLTALENFKRKAEENETKSSQNNGVPVVLVPSSKPSDNNSGSSNVQIIPLNSEEDIPNGSWLGDENNPQARVRVNIPPSILLHINEHNTTPEKMALTLLDYLFKKEVLAVSNVSGRGKHCKRQLDPLLVYGIRCHLVYLFDITDSDWHRIKQNIDSKCRSAWRKKIRGVPLGQSKASLVTSEDSSDGSVTGPQGTVKVLKKRDQLVHLTDVKTVKVFTDDEIKDLLVPPSVEYFSVEDSDCFNLSDQTLIITDTSEKTEEDPLYSSTKPNDFLVK